MEQVQGTFQSGSQSRLNVRHCWQAAARIVEVSIAGSFPCHSAVLVVRMLWKLTVVMLSHAGLTS
jgi:hypothetical protein